LRLSTEQQQQKHYSKHPDCYNIEDQEWREVRQSASHLVNSSRRTDLWHCRPLGRCLGPCCTDIALRSWMDGAAPLGSGRPPPLASGGYLCLNIQNTCKYNQYLSSVQLSITG